MMFGGPTTVIILRNLRKLFSHEVMHIMGEVLQHARGDVAITFDDSDLEGVKFPHDDPLIISLVIGNSEVKRVLVDNGTSVNIMLYDLCSKMEYIVS